MSREAADIVSALAAARKAIQLYPPAHPKFAEALSELVTAARAHTQAGPFVLNVHQGHVYHESVVVDDDVPGAASIAEALESRRIESLSLHAGFGEADALGLTEVLSLKPSPTLDVEQELAARDVSNASVAYLADDEETAREERDRLRQQDRKLYRQLVAVLRSLSSQLAEGGAPALDDAGRLVGSIMGRLMDDQAAVLGMATLRSSNEADLYHSINVMIYSLTLGAVLGLPEQGLASLGVSALLHDIGKSAFDRSDPAQEKAHRLMHPSVGAELLSRLQLDDPAAMLVAYEHHMAPDGGGFPDRPADYVPHPFSRMVAVADRYDNLTKPGGDSPAFTPDKAVARIMAEADGPLDRTFTRLFVKAIGVFPVGCMVRLADMRVGVVSGAGDTALTPRVRLLYDETGLELAEPTDVDLSEEQLTIVEVVDPADLNVEVAEKL